MPSNKRATCKQHIESDGYVCTGLYAVAMDSDGVCGHYCRLQRKHAGGHMSK
jgi:hypothetical protein